MAASFSDSFVLSQQVQFQNRVQAALFTSLVAIANEGFAVAFHRERQSFTVQILTNTTSPNPYVALFTSLVATDATVLADATQGGTVVLTTANSAAQSALVTDAHITSAISSQFNAFCREPAN